ncbi:DNA adenine methylase [Borrelia sp. RT5S]|uniref:DNA adenine methylase n=1 Tax=Borrelia sp. RT5S TaxID=2898581 RepID=UPI001E6420CC|nr:DNA adenine methylase [Borrelia sp. RT5S]UGQ16729.1 DNA adenine methylase [Borrelia sp. RT5S]
MKLLNREGSKYRYKERIIELFPKHSAYIEGFLGTGAIFLNKPLAQFNILNDHSRFIYKFFYILRRDPDYLYNSVKNALIYKDIMDENQDKIGYQILSLLYSLFGQVSNTMVVSRHNGKKIFLERFNKYKDLVLAKLEHAIITNQDIFRFLRMINKRVKTTKSSFMYLDPPYSMSKGGLVDNKDWSIDKLERLILELKRYPWLFAISEYDDPVVLQLFEKHGLNVHTVAKSSGLAATFGQIKHEILATSY